MLDVYSFVLWTSIVLIGIVILLILKVFVSYYLSDISKRINNTCLYSGRVQHVRLKGGSIHKLDYPLFLACIDVDELPVTKNIFWPLFSVNRPWSSFASFDFQHHLKDFEYQMLDYPKRINSFKEKLNQFINVKSKGKLTIDGSIQILTNLSYIGYCFNPISLYYLNNKDNKQLDAIIAEVSNTPWIEMNSYLLSKQVPEVKITQENDFIRAVWKKEFHVSPFMEMDYFYSFNFKKLGEKAIVKSSMLKESTNETWFTANFELDRMEFTPLNLLYVLTFYPLQTRLIQFYIHIEALKLFWKGVPTFSHPQGRDIEFGFGITGKNLSAFLWVIIEPFYSLYNMMNSSKVKSS